MKNYPAIALLEFRDISVGMHTTDAVVKKAPIAVLKCGTISHGRYLTLIGGSTASVQESYREGLLHGKDSIIDHVFLPDVDPALHDGMLGKRTAGPWHGAVGIIETQTISANVLAAEKALKATPVGLVELRLSDSWLAGKGVSIYHGDLHDIEAAMEVAITHLQEAGIDVLYRIITSPHEAITQQIGTSTHFVGSALLDLDGEVVDLSDGDTWVASASSRKASKPARKAAETPARKKKSPPAKPKKPRGAKKKIKAKKTRKKRR